MQMKICILYFLKKEDKMSEFKFDIDKNYDHIIEERGNAFIALRKIAWGNKEHKLDLRKWYSSASGVETMSKGVSFSDEGAHELVKVLTETGYGHTDEILEAIKNRDDFRSKLNMVLGKEDPEYDNTIVEEEVYYDPMKALFGGDEVA